MSRPSPFFRLEDDWMERHRPSRRQLLCGFLAGLCGWVCPARPAAALPNPRPGPRASRGPAAHPTQTVGLYDGAGRCIAVEPGPSAPVQTPTLTVDALGRLTTCAYYG